MKLSELVKIYIDRMSGGRWTSKNTIISKTSTLRCLLQAMPFDPVLEDVDDKLILTAIDKRWRKDVSTYSVNYTRIRTMLTWAKQHGYPLGDVDSIIDKNITPPDLDKKYLTYGEMRLTVKVLNEYENYRDAGAVEFAYWSHRREAEIFVMKRRDVDFTPKPNAPHGVYWFTETKASKGRQMLSLLEEEATCLKIWIDIYEKALGGEIPPNAYLFPSRVSAGKAVKGVPRKTRLMPFSEVAKKSRVFSEAYKLAGVYEEGKAGHAARRGGEEDTFVALQEAGVDDPIGVIIERSKQSRETAMAYLNRKASAERSNRAYALLSERRKEQQEPIKSEIVPNDANSHLGANVVAFRPRRAAQG